MFKHVIDPINSLNTNRFSRIQDIYADPSKYQPQCYLVYESGASDWSSGWLQDAFDFLQTELKNANDFYEANGIKTNFKCVGYDFTNQNTANNKLSFYAVIQDFEQVSVNSILYP